MSDPSAWSNMLNSDLSRLDSTNNRRVVDNPRFVYPPLFDRDAVSDKVYAMRRGYMRMLTELYDKDEMADTTSAATGKLWFQFNPNQLTRSVTAASDVQMWINLDPSQLAVPRPGNMNFGFQLLFNREAEVYANPTSAADMDSYDYMSILREAVQNNDGGIDWTKHVSKLGVLTDIMLLDNIVGQGLSLSLIEKIVSTQEWEELNSGTQSPATDEQTGSVIPFTEESLRETLNLNIGNGAFLSAQPVRVVFSKLFMVDGFVQTLTVTFNKFSRTLIPTIATVDVSMNALYIGFKRRDTVLTHYWNNRADRTGGVLNPIPEATSPDRARFDALKDVFDKGGFFTRVTWHGTNNTLNKFKSTTTGTIHTLSHAPINLDFYVPASGPQRNNFQFLVDTSISLTCKLELILIRWRRNEADPWKYFNTQTNGAGRDLNTIDTSISVQPIEFDQNIGLNVGSAAFTLRSANHTWSFQAPSNFVDTANKTLRYSDQAGSLQYQIWYKVSYSGTVGGATVEGPSTGVIVSPTLTSSGTSIGFRDKSLHPPARQQSPSSPQIIP
jgi:hypothetical protein